LLTNFLGFILKSGWRLTSIVELLSPAGGWEAFLAAVENGADAVYIGGKNFSARQSAENFDDAQIKAAVDYAHWPESSRWKI
jgi:U32 family peptidase